MMSIGFLNFLLWSIIIICGASGLGVFFKKNPVHSVLCLIVSFFSGAILMFINNSEFLAFILITVYVGAVAILFLFIVMMIDIAHLKNLKNKKIENFFALVIGLTFFFMIFNSFFHEISGSDSKYLKIQQSIHSSLGSLEENQLSKEKISIFVKTIYEGGHSLSLVFIALILLLAIIGVIVLTLREKTGLKKQSSISQNMRMKKDTLEIKKVNFGEGIRDDE